MDDFGKVNAIYGACARATRCWAMMVHAFPAESARVAHPPRAPRRLAGKYFPSDPPARATFAVKGLPLGAKVEIEATALH